MELWNDWISLAGTTGKLECLTLGFVKVGKRTFSKKIAMALAQVGENNLI